LVVLELHGSGGHIFADITDEQAKKVFLKGAEIAYEQIITSFAKGDKKSLKSLLGKNLNIK